MWYCGALSQMGHEVGKEEPGEHGGLLLDEVGHEIVGDIGVVGREGLGMFGVEAHDVVAGDQLDIEVEGLYIHRGPAFDMMKVHGGAWMGTDVQWHPQNSNRHKQRTF